MAIFSHDELFKNYIIGKYGAGVTYIYGFILSIFFSFLLILCLFFGTIESCKTQIKLIPSVEQI